MMVRVQLIPNATGIYRRARELQAVLGAIIRCWLTKAYLLSLRALARGTPPRGGDFLSRKRSGFCEFFLLLLARSVRSPPNFLSYIRAETVPLIGPPKASPTASC